MNKLTINLLSFFLTFNCFSQTITTVQSGQFSDGLAIDSQGVVYGSDWSGNTVYKYDTNGTVSVFKNGFSNPNGIAVNSQDEIYICDHTANRIKKYDTSGNLIQEFITGLTTPAGIKNIPNTNDMLIVEYGVWNYTTGQVIYSSKIKKLDENGFITTLFDGTPLNGPAGITYIDDELYVANFNDRRIFKFDGGFLTQVAQLPASGASSNFIGFLTSLQGQLYATQIGGNKIYRIDPSTGQVTIYAGSVAGTADGDISVATFNGPNGILADPVNNRIYVSDSATLDLRIIDNASLSIEKFDTPAFYVNLYPNPSKDSLNVKLKQLLSDNIIISIFDANGKEVYKKEHQTNGGEFNTNINTTKFSNGIYSLNIKSGSKVISKKVVF